MEVIYPKACGVDVHKSFIVAVLCDSTTITPKYLRKRFSTDNNSLIEFRNWLIDNDCQNVCMESTGKYYVSVYNTLENHISNVVIANPKWVKAIKGEKDDNNDAKWIADFFKMGLVRSSYIPSKDFRILREFTRDRYKLTNTKSSEKNRFTNALTVINCKSSHDDILSSINGIQLTHEQKLRINIVKEHIDYINDQIIKLNDIIDTLVLTYESYIDLLCTIPGIKRNSAIGILSKISNDMSQFKSHYRLISWDGLAPSCNESAGKKKSVKISRAGVYLKPYFVEVAHCAVKDRTNSYYAKKFEKISKRRGQKHTYIAIARKILVAIYHMFISSEVGNPTDLASVETPIQDRIKFTKNNLNQSFKQLLSLGLTSEELIELINQNANKLPVWFLTFFGVRGSLPFFTWFYKINLFFVFRLNT